MGINSTFINNFEDFDFKEYFDEIVLYLRRMGIEEADAEDLTQQVFCKFTLKVKRDSGFMEKLRSKGIWYASARNLAMEYFRERKTYREFVREYSKLSGGMDVFQWLQERNEQHFDLLKEIKALPKREQSILEKVLENKSNDEIAHALDISYTSVTTRKSNALKKLAEKLHLSLLLHHVWDILFSILLWGWGLLRHLLERH